MCELQNQIAQAQVGLKIVYCWTGTKTQVSKMTNLPNYPAFDVVDDPTVANKWEDWLDGFEAMVRAMKITAEGRKRDLFLHYIGTGGRKLLKRLEDTGTPGEEGEYTKPIAALTQFFTPKLDRLYLMNKLQHMKQGPTESIDSFYIRICEMTDRISLEALEKSELVDLIKLSQMVKKCRDPGVRKKALRDELSLKQFLSAARAGERTDMEIKDLDEEEEVPVSVEPPISAIQRAQGKYVPNQGRPRGTFQEKKCFRCGGRYPHEKDCPADGKECDKCHRIGHFAKMCKTRKVNYVQAEAGGGYDPGSQDYKHNYVTIPMIGQVGDTQESSLRNVTVRIGDQDVPCLLDSGAEVNIIGEKTFESLQITGLKAPSRKLCGYGSKKELPVIGMFSGKIKAPQTMLATVSDIYVMKGNSVNLLGCATAEKLGLIKFINTVDMKSTLHVEKDYADIFEGIGKMKDTQVKLSINEDVKPIAQTKRKIPFHLREKVSEETQRLQELDIIEESSGPTPWVSPVVIITKSEVEIRLCIDSRAINTAIERERHPMNTIEDLIVEINGSQVFSKIDLNKGYHQIELALESRYITTFATHDGLFRYKRLCFGVNSAAELFQKAIADMLRDIPGVMNMSDDIIMFSRTHEEHRKTVRRVLQRLRDYNITANAGKCEFFKDKITFYGHIFSKDGVSPNPQRISAVVDALPPKNPEDVRSLLGMAQYVARFCPKYSMIVEPLRKLTHKDTVWKWDQEEENAFEELKETMANWNMVRYFDIQLQTELVVDAGPRGLGAILSQIGLDGQTHVVEYGSRALSDTESRYSQTERETLAVVWGCEHFSHYLEGSDFTVVTDHKPLEGIIRKTTAQPTARIHRLMLRLQPYRLNIIYRPGKTNPADYLSRHVRWASIPKGKSWLDDQTYNVVIHAVHSYGLILDELKEETSRDECLQKVINAITTGKWDTIHKEHSSYWNIRDELSVSEGLVIRGERIVIPEILQNRVVNIAHASHQGIVKTKALLRETVWFPGIDRLVEKVVASCLPCQANTKVKNAEPLKMTELPKGPWKEVSVDFCGPFSTGEYLLVVIDDYSRFPEVETLHSTSYEATKPKLDAIFSRQGYPEVLKSDNGPPFQGQEFAAWAKERGFTHRKITPLWPQANGEAERFMRSLGKAIKAAVVEKRNWKSQINTFLRHYRATPHCTTGLSPSEMLTKRKLRTEILFFYKEGKGDGRQD